MLSGRTKVDSAVLGLRHSFGTFRSWLQSSPSMQQKKPIHLCPFSYPHLLHEQETCAGFRSTSNIRHCNWQHKILPREKKNERVIPLTSQISAWCFYRSNKSPKTGFIILMQKYWDKLKTINDAKDTTSNAFTCLNQFGCFDTPTILVYIYPSERQNKHITQSSLYI